MNEEAAVGTGPVAQGPVTRSDVVITPSKSDRLTTYLAPLLDLEQKRFPLDPEKTLIAAAHRSFDRACKRSERYIQRYGLETNETRRNLFIEGYWRPMVQVHKRIGIKRRFQVVLGDDTTPSRSPAFHKARRIDGCGMDVLVPLNPRRHFALLRHSAKFDRPYSEKIGKLLWRGATTGVFGGDAMVSRFHLYKEWGRWQKTEALDFGFTNMTANKVHYTTPGGVDIDDCQTPRIGVEEQLKYKYLLCLEGNDVASGLKWMLSSNSLVLMPRPTMVSWACENLLRPGVHYVEVKPDLSDLEDVYAWCEANPAVCEEIAQNGKSFMAPFYDEDLETELFDIVVRRYHRLVRLFNPDAAEADE